MEGKLQAACADNLKLSKDAQDKTEALATHKASVKSLEDDLSSLKAAKAECEERIKEQADAHDKLQAYNVDLQKYNSKMSAEAEKHAEIVSALQTEKAGVQSELAASQGQCATLEGSVAASKEQLADANARRSELEDKLANVESELKQATATLTSTKAELAASEAALAKSKQEAESRAADIKELTEAKFAVEAELQAASAQAASLGEKCVVSAGYAHAARRSRVSHTTRIADTTLRTHLLRAPLRVLRERSGSPPSKRSSSPRRRRAPRFRAS